MKKEVLSLKTEGRRLDTYLSRQWRGLGKFWLWIVEMLEGREGGSCRDLWYGCWVVDQSASRGMENQGAVYFWRGALLYCVKHLVRQHVIASRWSRLDGELWTRCEGCWKEKLHRSSVLGGSCLWYSRGKQLESGYLGGWFCIRDRKWWGTGPVTVKAWGQDAGDMVPWGWHLMPHDPSLFSRNHMVTPISCSLTSQDQLWRMLQTLQKIFLK